MKQGIIIQLLVIVKKRHEACVVVNEDHSFH